MAVQRPDVYHQMQAAVHGIAEACDALGTPVISGNVSLYNESGDTPIYPTPVIGMLGILDDVTQHCMMAPAPGDEMFVEGPFVALNQKQPEIVEVGAFVKLDRVKWIDIRAIDQDGNELPCADPFRGGWPVPKDDSQIYPSNASEWTYVRKCFLSDKP